MKGRLNLVSEFEKRIEELEKDIRQASDNNDESIGKIEFIHSCMNDIMILEDRMLALKYTI